MTPLGTIEDGGRTLVLTRRFTTPIDHVWAAITESERLARWFGTWSGDPSTGSVLVTMNAEAEPVPPARYDIRACDPPRLLSVSAVDDGGQWHLTATLTEADGGTTLVLRQEDLDPATVADTGPGWDWYLDRLVATITGAEPPSLAAFDADYAPRGAAYAALTPSDT